MNNFEKYITFYKSLPNPVLPEGIELLNPYTSTEVIRVIHLFFEKYYADKNERYLILGINPGRFGAGITGISFTDPIRLHRVCGIKNSFQNRPELSSVFIYELIEAFGGTEKFYNAFFLSAVSPLGFISNGKNINYYDSKELQRSVNPFIEKTLELQFQLPVSKKKVYCLGMGENVKYLQKLNQRLNYFEKLIPLPHPRWIMQYRRKEKESFIEQMVSLLNND